MNRRSILTAAAAAALVTVPSAAMAYSAPEVQTKVADATPVAGKGTVVSFEGLEAGEPVTLTVTSANVPDSAIEIAGTKSLTKNATDAGVASFTVTLGQAGAFELVATDSEGTVIGQSTLNVEAAPAAAPTAGGDTGTTEGGLPVTGGEPAALAIGAGALLAAGAGAIAFQRRRQSVQG